MRIIRILNIAVVVAFIALWAILLIKRESFQGDGLMHPLGVNPDSTYYSESLPYGIEYRNAFWGFTSQHSGKRDVATGLWKINPITGLASHLPFPMTHRFDSLIAILPMPDSTLTLVGLQDDSLVKIIRLDSAVRPGMVFAAPAEIKAVQVIGEHPEIVFGRQKKLVGSIVAIGDTSVRFRKYELPGFFDRICEIVSAYPEKGKWRFLLRTDFYRRKDKWIILDSSRKTNFLVFDERAVYPDFPGILKMNKRRFLKSFDYTLSGLLPMGHYPDTLITLDKNKFSRKTIYPGLENQMFWVSVQANTSQLTMTGWDDAALESGFLVRYPWGGFPSNVLPFVSDSANFVFHISDKPDNRQIFLAPQEQPIGFFKIGNDSLILLTNRLNYAFLSPNGKLLDRKNFFTLVNSTVHKKIPGTFHLLDTELPAIKAMVWFTMLYGLLPLWLLSMVIIWLVEAIKSKPKFAVRERPWSFSMRLMPGTVLYFLLYIFNVYSFLSSFSISFF